MRRKGADRGELGAALLAQRHAMLEAGEQRPVRADDDAAVVAVDEDRLAFVDAVADVVQAADHRHADRPRDDRHVRGQRAFLEQHGLQPAAVIFEQLGGPEVAGDQDRVAREAGLRRGAHAPRDDAQQPVRQVLEVVHPLLKQRIVDLAHPRAGALLDALDRRFGGEAAVDRLVDPPRPALVVGEHAVGLEDLLMLAGGAELRLARHGVDLLAHLAEGGIDALALGLDVLGDGMLDDDARLVEDRFALGHSGDQLEAGEAQRAGAAQAAAARAVDQPRAGDHLRQHHRDRLQRLDLDILVAARLGMLHGEHADRAFEADDRHAGEAVEALLAGFGPVGEGRDARPLRRG